VNAQIKHFAAKLMNGQRVAKLNAQKPAKLMNARQTAKVNAQI
jgi:hypothetical protein